MIDDTKLVTTNKAVRVSITAIGVVGNGIEQENRCGHGGHRA